MKDTVTREEAEAVLAAVIEKFRPYVVEEAMEGDRPFLKENYDGASYAIIWEGNSPYEWAYDVRGTYVDEEMAELLSEFTDRPLGAASSKAPQFPDTVFLEPIMSFVLGIYPLGDFA